MVVLEQNQKFLRPLPVASYAFFSSASSITKMPTPSEEHFNESSQSQNKKILVPPLEFYPCSHFFMSETVQLFYQASTLNVLFQFPNLDKA